MATAKKAAAPKTKAAKKEEANPMKKNWEKKTRYYYLLGRNIEQPAHIIKSKNIQWYDDSKQEWRDIMYASNQKHTIFVDEFNGKPRASHIIFRDGLLEVDERDMLLQKFLSIHPDNGRVFAEQDAEVDAQEDLEDMDLAYEAETAARSLDFEVLESIVRTDVGSKINKMTVSEIKHDAIALSRKNPEMFLALANDSRIKLRNMGIKGVEQGVIRLAEDNRTFVLGSTGQELFKVPFGEQQYSALAAYLQTDEGLEIYDLIEKSLKN